MKKKCKILFFLLAFCLAFAVNAFAYGSQGLDNFTASNVYGSQTFSDIRTDNWFYTGVKKMYETGIMAGMGNNCFAPDANVTTAQAITIAARVHATYYNNTIEDVDGGQWYTKYYAYAKANNILPDSITDSEESMDENATRGVIAYLFNQVIAQSDLETINNAEIPDFDSIDPSYQDAVKNMYVAGIIAGKDSAGNFIADGLATRAEIATIITRLIDKIERVAYDSKYNASMAGQEGNLFTGNILVYDDSFSYHATCSDNDTYQIIKKNRGSGEVTALYTGQGTISSLLLCGRDLYFMENYYDSDDIHTGTDLKKLNLDTLDATIVYSDINLDLYTIYDGNIYVTTYYPIDYYVGPKIAIGKVTGPDSITILYDTGHTIYELGTFNDCLYFNQDSALYKLNLQNRASAKIINQVWYCSIVKNIVYYADYSGDIYKCSLLNPTDKKLIALVDLNKMSNLRGLNFTGNKLYLSFESEWAIYTIGSGNTIERYCLLKEHPAIFSVLDGKIFYSSSHSSKSDYVLIGGTDIAQSQNQHFTDWLSGTTVTEQETTDEASNERKILSSDEIYDKCAPAVFMLYALDEDGNIIATGSGFFISADGKAITNYHVVSSAYNIAIQTANGQIYYADSITGLDTDKDIVQLQFNDKTFDYLEVGDSSTVETGDKIYAIGSPLGKLNTISEGLVSNNNVLVGTQHWFQISTPITYGSSGGALINEYGEVVGITAAGIESGEDFNFAIPINHLRYLKYQ